MHSALASLGIVYAVCLFALSDLPGCLLTLQDEEIEVIYSQMEEDFGMVTYEAWLALLVGPFILWALNAPD